MVRYENPWRPNYEAAAVAGWVVIGVFSWGTADLWGLHEAPFRYLAGFAVLMTVTWMPGAMRQCSYCSELSRMTMMCPVSGKRKASVRNPSMAPENPV